MRKITSRWKLSCTVKAHDSPIWLGIRTICLPKDEVVALKFTRIQITGRRWPTQIHNFTPKLSSYTRNWFYFIFNTILQEESMKLDFCTISSFQCCCGNLCTTVHPLFSNIYQHTGDKINSAHSFGVKRLYYRSNLFDKGVNWQGIKMTRSNMTLTCEGSKICSQQEVVILQRVPPHPLYINLDAKHVIILLCVTHISEIGPLSLLIHSKFVF